MQSYNTSTLEAIASRCHIDPLKGCSVSGGTTGVNLGNLKQNTHRLTFEDPPCPPNYLSVSFWSFCLANYQQIPHLCHNSLCSIGFHLVLEPFVVNNARKSCARSGQCSGHGDQASYMLWKRWHLLRNLSFFFECMFIFDIPGTDVTSQTP